MNFPMKIITNLVNHFRLEFEHISDSLKDRTEPELPQSLSFQ